jgi:hypothetical protein
VNIKSTPWKLNAMKTERITFLSSPDFKHYLAAQALNDGTSVGELIRTRCLAQEGKASSEAENQERELIALTNELRRSIVEARHSLRDGLQAAAKAMNSIRDARDHAASGNVA